MFGHLDCTQPSVGFGNTNMRLQQLVFFMYLYQHQWLDVADNTYPYEIVDEQQVGELTGMQNKEERTNANFFALSNVGVFGAKTFRNLTSLHMVWVPSGTCSRSNIYY
ncbi:conserved hypothetical protein [Ricinus communis]|uniref:Uncharacterized protein n=1 Tax=Ricinus communis TaxID=3988 RepID=B9S9V7_RICCO|nr:conserved hypothetical protein [Ricinus communis]